MQRRCVADERAGGGHKRAEVHSAVWASRGAPFIVPRHVPGRASVRGFACNALVPRQLTQTSCLFSSTKRASLSHSQALRMNEGMRARVTLAALSMFKVLISPGLI